MAIQAVTSNESALSKQSNMLQTTLGGTPHAPLDTAIQVTTAAESSVRELAAKLNSVFETVTMVREADADDHNPHCRKPLDQQCPSSDKLKTTMQGVKLFAADEHGKIDARIWHSVEAMEEAERVLSSAALNHAEKLGQNLKDHAISISFSGSLTLSDSHSHKELTTYLDDFARTQTEAQAASRALIETSESSLLKSAEAIKSELLSEVDGFVKGALSSLGEHLVASESLEETVQRLQHESETEKNRADAACEQLAATKLQLHHAQNQIRRLESVQDAQERESKALMQAMRSSEELLQLAAANVAKQHSVICELQDENLQLIDSSFSAIKPATPKEAEVVVSKSQSRGQAPAQPAAAGGNAVFGQSKKPRTE